MSATSYGYVIVIVETLNPHRIMLGIARSEEYDASTAALDAATYTLTDHEYTLDEALDLVPQIYTILGMYIESDKTMDHCIRKVKPDVDSLFADELEEAIYKLIGIKSLRGI